LKGYVIAIVEVTDAAAYEAYRRGVGATVENFGGRFLVRGGAATPLEGDMGGGRLVVLEFPDPATARAWYDSDAYAGLKRQRIAASRSRLVLVEGHEPPMLA
jgi:uncharacterized protein (DUF1330 family)